MSFIANAYAQDIEAEHQANAVAQPHGNIVEKQTGYEPEADADGEYRLHHY